MAADGTRVYKKPSELTNFWATSEVDQQNFASWCYDTNGTIVSPVMEAMKNNALTQP